MRLNILLENEKEFNSIIISEKKDGLFELSYFKYNKIKKINIRKNKYYESIKINII